MHRVQFLKDTATADLSDAPERTLVVYRDGFGYSPPPCHGAEYMEFLEYREKYPALEPEMIVVVGINRMITPSNRCDMVNEYLQTMTPNIPKVSIDNAPFIGEPWRLWWHYDVANIEKWGVSYSYAIETEWKKWFYREQSTCRLDAENIGLFLTDTVSDLEPLSVRFSFSEPTADDEAWYKEAKTAVFNQHNTPKMWINNLLKLCNRRYDLKISLDTYRAGIARQHSIFDQDHIELPDHGVYRFVAEENIRRMAIYNEVISFERR